MKTTMLRRTLDAYPRVLLVVLLAFAIEMVPPAAMVEHRHAHGDAAHVHAGRIVAAGRRSVTAPADRKTPVDGVLAATGDGLHRHTGDPRMVGTLPEIVAVAPPAIVRPLPQLVPLRALPVLQPSCARSSPSRVG